MKENANLAINASEKEPEFMANNADYNAPLLPPSSERKIAVRTSTKDTIDASQVLYEFIRPIQHGSLREAVSCMICVTLGTGMLPLPYFFKTNGIVLTLIIFTICGLATYKTLQTLIKIAHQNKIYNYYEVVRVYFGPGMTAYAIVVLLINSFGSIILWDVYVKIFLKDIVGYFNEDYSTDVNIILLLIFILCAVQIPLALNNSQKIYDIMSIIGVLQILYVIVILFLEFPKYASKNFTFERMMKPQVYFNFNWKLIEMPFVFFIAFGNHSTILSVINEVKPKTETSVLNVGKRTYFGEYFIYLTVFFIAYFSTYEKTAEVFLTRPNLSLLMMIGEINMAILMICNVSLYYFTTMPTLVYLFNNSEKFEGGGNFLVGFTVLSILMFVSFFINHVTTILSLLGIFAQVSLIFILPICLYLKENEQRLSSGEKIKYIFMLGFFSFLGLGGFILMLIFRFFNGSA